MSEFTPRRENRWLTLLVEFCQLLPLILGIPMLVVGVYYLVQGELIGAIGILVGAILTLLIFFFGMLPQIRMDWRQRHLRTSGIAAQGEVITSEFSGTLINNLPQYRLQIRYVHPDTGQDHIAKTLLVVNYSVAAALTPGASVALKVSRDRPDHIAIA